MSAGWTRIAAGIRAQLGLGAFDTLCYTAQIYSIRGYRMTQVWALALLLPATPQAQISQQRKQSIPPAKWFGSGLLVKQRTASGCRAL